MRTSTLAHMLGARIGPFVAVASLWCLAIVTSAHGQSAGFETRQWIPEAQFPVAAYQYDPVEHNRRLYVAGGWDGTSLNTIFSAAIRSDGSLERWQLLPTRMPFDDQAPGAAIVNGRLFLSRTDGAGELISYPINADGTLGPLHEETTPVPAERRGGRLGVRAYASNLYLVGGWGGGCTFYADVFVSHVGADGSLGPWVQTTPMPEPRQHVVSWFTGGRMYIAGGITSCQTILDSVYSAQINGDGTLASWRPEPSLPGPRWVHCGFAIGNSLYILGGRSGYAGGWDHNVFRAIIGPGGALSNWEDVGDLPSNFVDAPGVVYVPCADSVYMIGGQRDPGRVFTSEVWRGGFCPADFNRDGVVNSQDFFDFLTAFFAGC